MSELVVRFPGGTQSFHPGRVVSVGRDSSCDVTIADDRVSRAPHLEVRFDGATWVMQDRSSGGTYCDGQRVAQAPISGSITFRLGSDPNGPLITLTATPAMRQPQPQPARASAAHSAPRGAAAPPHPIPGVAPAPPPPAPTSRPQAAGMPARFSTISANDATLRLCLDGTEKTFLPGAVVGVGRAEDADIRSDNLLVSRRHARFYSRGTRWFVQDLGTERGTYIDGRRIKGTAPVVGAFSIWLGGDGAGAEMKVVTAGEHVPPKAKASKAPAIMGITASLLAILAVVGGVAWFLSRPEPDVVIDGGGSNTPEQLASVKSSTMMIGMVDKGGRIYGWGTGVLVSSDGYILTNAHVAKPTSKANWLPVAQKREKDPDPASLVVAVSPKPDAPVKEAFAAEVVATDERQDAALIRVTGTLPGSPVSLASLKPVPIGNSDSLRAGDKVHALGYPLISQTFDISVVEGSVISFIEDYETPNGDLRMMNTDASLGGGSSGGPVVKNGELVGLNDLGTVNDPDFEESNLDRAQTIPINEIRALLAKAGLHPATP